MGNILVSHRNEIMAIIANYLIGVSVKITVEKLLSLGVTIENIPTIKKIFIKDVSPTCCRLNLYDPYLYDSYWYVFTPESIVKEIKITNSCLFTKLLFHVWFLWCNKIYYTSWNILQNEFEHIYSIKL
jgi:hypothetical protein